tara:strand:- start:904 stop:2568 length:1665 start_codon:yes stop_codon:yes gene_type:complete
MESKKLVLDLLEQEVEDFIQTQAEKVIEFEDDPMAYILNKYPSLNDTLTDLMTKHFGDYVTGIYVMAPKPTTFKILLHNGQFYYLIYAKDSYIAKIMGKKYYLLDLGAEEYAIKAIADLLTMGKPPGAKGPDDQEDNITITDKETTTDIDVTDDGGGDEEDLSEAKEKDPETDDYGRPFVDPKGSRTYMDPDEMTPYARFKKMMGEKKIKIVKEVKEAKKNSLKFKILKENDAEKGIEILKKELNLTDNDFVKQSSLTYKLLVPRAERFDYATKIDKIEDFEFDPNLKGSSIGGVKYKNSKFLIKPTGVQGRASAGTENEDVLVNEVRKYLDEGAKNVIFNGSNKNYVTKNIKEIKDVGYDTASGKKADVVLIGDKDYPISIKKDNAGFWESSDTRYKAVVNKLSEKIKNGDYAPQLVFRPYVDKMGNTKEGINLMYNDETNQPVSGVIVTDLPSKEEDSIIFGSDDAVVVYKTFLPSDFELKGDNLNVKVTKIITDMKDIENFNLEPVVNIRRDVTRTATGGLRATVQPENLLYRDGKLTGNKIELTYNEIMN